MTGVQAWSFADASLRPQSGRGGGALDAEPSADLHAAWEVVFENARAVNHSAGTALDNGARQAREDRAAKQVGPGTASSGPQPVGLGQGAITTATTTSSRVALPRSVLPQDDQISAQHTGKPLMVARLQEELRADRAAPVRNGAAPAPAQPRLVLEPLASVPPSSEIVNLQAESVSIVLRDAKLSEPEALRCAFEAAHQITGRRSALRLLMLNGRTLYCPPELPTTPSPTITTLVFAC
jgi:hypothetical protein